MGLNTSTDEESKVLDKEAEQLLRELPKLSEIFQIHQRVGEGTFSTVYLGTLKNDPVKVKKFAIKHIVPTCHPERIRFELECLKNLGGQNNIAGLNLCLRERNTVVFIMPFQHHEPFNDYVAKMDAPETASYIKNLLKAVAHIHKNGIIHRDIKPSNFLYDRKAKRYLLVDFGLAQKVKVPENTLKRKRDSESDSANLAPSSKRPFVENIYLSKLDCKLTNKKKCSKENNPETKKTEEITVDIEISKKSSQKFEHHSCKCYGKPMTCSVCIVRKALWASRAGTPGFRPPEVLLKSLNQTTAVDIWAVGVILICILSGCTNFFSSPDDVTALLEIMTLFGTEAIKKVAMACGRHLICSEKLDGLDLRELCKQLRSRGKGTGTESVEESEIFPDGAFSLLKRLMDVNPNTRISAEAAMNHEFLADIKD